MRCGAGCGPNDIVAGRVQDQICSSRSFSQNLHIVCACHLADYLVAVCVYNTVYCVHGCTCASNALHVFMYVCMQPDVVHGCRHGACVRVCV